MQPEAKPRVLVVDDDEQIARALQRLFRLASFDVASASDGRAALSLLATFEPDVVISDSRMPLMTGSELVREVRLRRPETVCLILSGSLEIDAPGCECIAKPVEGKLLIAAVRARIAHRDKHAA